jgi:hypothetical protein
MKTQHFLQVTLGLAIALVTHQNLHGQRVNDLWQVYQTTLRKAKYVDLTHTITPTIPVWKGFGPSKFAPTVNPENGAQNPRPLDKHYETIRMAMQGVFDELGLAA